MGGVAMAQHVWRDSSVDVRALSCLLHHLLQASGAMRFMSFFSFKQPSLLWTCRKMSRKQIRKPWRFVEI